MGAAPRFNRFRSAVGAIFSLALVLLAPAAMPANGSSHTRTAAPFALWVVQLPAASSAKVSSPVFAQMRKAGVTTLIVRRGGWPSAAHRALVRLAEQNKTRIVEPRVEP